MKTKNLMYKDMLNKKVLVRSYDAGVYFGTLTQVDGDTVRMENVRNIWKWEGASCLSQIANDGIRAGKVSPAVSSMVLNRVCQVIPLTATAIANLEGQRTWKY